MNTKKPMPYQYYQCMLCGIVEKRYDPWTNSWYGLRELLEEKEYKFIEPSDEEDNDPDFCFCCISKVIKHSSELSKDAFNLSSN